jgi:predicted nucleotidyltransferase
MTSSKAPHYGKFRSKVLRSLFTSPLPAVASHWLFQSLFYMAPTERWFKIGLDIGLTLVFLLPLRQRLALAPALMFSFLAAHTLNFLFNGQLWGVLKQYDWVHTTPQAFEDYCAGLSQRGRREPSIRHLYAYGSLSRQEWTPSSDLDVRLVRYPGFSNGLRACWFVLRERSRALVAKFPLDIYVVDRLSDLQKLSPSEPPVDILTADIMLHRPSPACASKG